MYHNQPYSPEEMATGYPPEYEQEEYQQQHQSPHPQSSFVYPKPKPFFTKRNAVLFCIGLFILWWLLTNQTHSPQLDLSPVHNDQTEVQLPIHRQVENTIPMVYSNQDGELKRVLADKTAYSNFVKIHTDNLEQARKRLQIQAKQQLAQQLNIVFQPVEQRIDRFADWYFAYGTSYTLLWEMLTSATVHLNGEHNLKDAVAQDLDNLLQQQYQTIVLKPEITDPQLQRAYKQSLDNAHQGYLNIISVMQAEFQLFVAEHTTHIDGFNHNEAVLKLDWHSQFNKVDMADYAKGSLGAVRGITLATLAGIAGKSLGRETGKILFPKLIAPLVSRTATVSTSGVTGGGLGTLGGPVGSVAGAGIGIGAGITVDWLINEGIEIVNRDTFITDAQTALQTTQTEWKSVLSQSLQQVIDVWFTDTLQLLAQYEQQNP